MATRALHVSDLHAGRRETPGLEAALAALAAEVEPELVVATGDLAHRGRPAELEAARSLLEAAGRPVLAVPGNHDIPYVPVARATRPWRPFEEVFATTAPVYASERLTVCGLNSVRPWRHQGGRLSPAALAAAARALAEAPPGALRVVALHHHLTGSPWRAARKLPLRRRDEALAALAAAGADLVLGGHIHQASVAHRHEFDARAADVPGVVLATAPGLGRPRPRRPGEAQGALVVEWDDELLTLHTYLLDGGRFRHAARRAFPRAAR